MNKAELAKRVTTKVRDLGLRKPVTSPRHVFHISDDSGNSKDFVIKQKDRSVIYTIDDVNNILDACIDVIKDALVHGDDINIRGFGTLGLKYRKARSTLKIETGEPITIDARYIPKFSFGSDLRMCAKLYELSLADKVVDGDVVPNPEMWGDEE